MHERKKQYGHARETKEMIVLLTESETCDIRLEQGDLMIKEEEREETA